MNLSRSLTEDVAAFSKIRDASELLPAAVAHQIPVAGAHCGLGEMREISLVLYDISLSLRHIDRINVVNLS